MFTGLVQDIGTIERLERRGPGALVHISCQLSDFVLGESICVSGACLSVTTFERGRFSAFASAETLSRTELAQRRSGTAVNLERALRVGDALAGHIVTGHVDTRVALLDKQTSGDASALTWAMPPDALGNQLASKGSVALDGVSLTINDVKDRSFTTMIIPLTLAHTTLGHLAIGDRVCLETDVLAKYVARQLGRTASETGISAEFLARAGF